MTIIYLFLLACEGLLWLTYIIGFALSVIIPLFWICAEISCCLTDKIQTFRGFFWLLADYFFWVFFIACLSYYLKGYFEFWANTVNYELALKRRKSLEGKG